MFKRKYRGTIKSVFFFIIFNNIKKIGLKLFHFLYLIIYIIPSPNKPILDNNFIVKQKYEQFETRVFVEFCQKIGKRLFILPHALIYFQIQTFGAILNLLRCSCI